MATSCAVHVLMYKFGTTETPHNLILLTPQEQPLTGFGKYLVYSLDIKLEGLHLGCDGNRTSCFTLGDIVYPELP